MQLWVWFGRNLAVAMSGLGVKNGSRRSGAKPTRQGFSLLLVCYSVLAVQGALTCATAGKPKVVILLKGETK